MKKIYTLFTLLIASYFAFSQITLTQGDFPFKGFKKDYYEASSSSIDVGGSGANQTFDFSNLSMVYDTFNVEMMDPSNTPFPGQHNGANLAMLIEYEEDSATQQTVLELWNFMKTSSQESKSIGISVKVDTGYMFGGSPPSSMISVNSAYNPQYTFVSTQNTYLSSKTYNGAWSATIGALKHDETQMREIEVDAWGTLKNPWQEFDALRFKVREINTGVDTIGGKFDDMWMDTMHYFEYWIKGFGYYAARAFTNDDYSMVYDVEVAAQKYPVGIDVESNQIEVSVYPIPCNDLLYIEIEKEGPIYYDLSEISGRKIRNGQLNPNGKKTCHLNLENISKGFYLLHLYEGENSIVRKRIVIE